MLYLHAKIRRKSAEPETMSDLMPFHAGFGGLGFPNSARFEQNYRCYSASFIDKPHLENGDKVIMPPSALDRLASLRIDYPMLFEVHNPQTLRTSHCGVLEFVAEEGMIYLPYWMMQNMFLQEGDLLKIKSATLPKGTFVKLQPHTQDFLDISNPKAVLETTLRNFSCLTVGDNIMVAYNKKEYYIHIIEAKPANAVSVIETDCEVDFALPLDYKEQERVPATIQVPVVSTPQAAKEAPEPPKFNPFQGSARRLDGKPTKVVTPPTARAGSDVISPRRSNTTASSPQPLTPSPQRPPGKLIFGTSIDDKTALPKAASTPRKVENKEEPQKQEPSEDEPPKFQAFTGKKYTL